MLVANALVGYAVPALLAARHRHRKLSSCVRREEPYGQRSRGGCIRHVDSMTLLRRCLDSSAAGICQNEGEDRAVVGAFEVLFGALGNR